MAVKAYYKTDDTKVSANFKASEFACKGNGCCTAMQIDEKLVSYLQSIRDYFGKPVTITSGYRCTKHNKNVGGVGNSYHTKGMAADIIIKDVTTAEVAKYAESIGVKGIGLYDTFVHIDTRTTKSFWYSDKQEKRTTFGGGSNVSANTNVKEWQTAAIADGYKFASGADGIWGNECETVAKNAVCRKYAWPWKNKNLTQIIQRTVGITADGKFGNGTKTAVMNWQSANGLAADGVVGYNTWKKILNV